MRRIFLTVCLLTLSVGAQAADPLCQKLDSFVADQKSETVAPAPRHWVEFHWGIDPDPNTFWSWGCRHSVDLSSKQFCSWLLDNTSREFRAFLPIRVQKCMGFRFPGHTMNEWHLTEGKISHQLKDGSWLALELSANGLQPGESAVRISYDTVDRRLEPDELPPIQALKLGEEVRVP